MTFVFWLQFATVCVAGAMSPGPSLALIIRNSITINRFAGFMTAVGHGLGMGVHPVFAVSGLLKLRVVKGDWPMLPKIEFTADSSVSGSIVVVAIDKKKGTRRSRINV